MCDKGIHNELAKTEVICVFCNKQINQNNAKRDDACCENQKIENLSHQYTCISCGRVNGFEIAEEYIDFYENRYRIIKKSIRNRKYHLDNIINNICDKNDLSTSQDNRFRIHKIFTEIDKILPQINGARKRMISISSFEKDLKVDEVGFEKDINQSIK